MLIPPVARTARKPDSNRHLPFSVLDSIHDCDAAERNRSIREPMSQMSIPRTLAVLIVLQAFAALLVACSDDLKATSAPNLRGNLYGTPEYDKLDVGNGVIARFTACEPIGAPVPHSIALYHLPSASAVYLYNDGVMAPGDPLYKSDEGRERLEAVLADDALMEQIVARWPKSTRCPPELLEPTRVIHSSAELYDPNQSRFIPTGDMQIARIGHAVTLLQDGSVLITGGSTPLLRPIASAELFDPKTGAFSFTGDMNSPRIDNVSILLPDGRALIAGGKGFGGVLASAEIYNPQTGLFSTTTSMNVARRGSTATLLQNGKVLVIGGTNHTARASAEMYDPQTGAFSRTWNMASERTNHTASLMPDGRVLVVGGDEVKSGEGNTSAEIFDPNTSEFSPADDMDGRRIDHTATVLIGGRVLIAGGWEGLDDYATSFEIYEVGKGFSSTDGLSTSRESHTATLLSDGHVLITGGLGEGQTLALTSTELYDPSTGETEITADMTVERFGHQAILLQNGNVLISGGYSRHQ